MPRPHRIEGYAIISADGMIADADGAQPAELIVKADQRFFRRGLARADAIAHGRFSHEGGTRSAERKRLILTRSIGSLAPHPRHAKGLLWNPAGASFEQAWQALEVADGVLAVIGGTDTFGLFLGIGYDAFHLTRANRARLPGGRPVFPDVPSRSPEDVLAAHGLNPGPPEVLDADADVTLVTWDRGT
ncbi:MAG: dihydrofolate reductase [Xanthobacteraceae bacterium]|jgi:dihydrofolate reductase